MRPTKKHMKVDRYVDPAEFDTWRTVAEKMGFLYVASGPLVRSSYKVSGKMICQLNLVYGLSLSCTVDRPANFSCTMS